MVRSPFASSFVGGDSPAENPTDFLRAVFGLFDQYLLRCATTTSCPLIINTQGWVKGLGYVMQLDVLRYCAPSVVVQIEAGVFKKDLPELVAVINDPEEPDGYFALGRTTRLRLLGKMARAGVTTVSEDRFCFASTLYRWLASATLT